MSVARALRQPGIADPAFRRATGVAFLLGYNARVRGRLGREENPFSKWISTRHHAAWRDGWDLADKRGLLVELPDQK